AATRAGPALLAPDLCTVCSAVMLNSPARHAANACKLAWGCVRPAPPGRREPPCGPRENASAAVTPVTWGPVPSDLSLGTCHLGPVTWDALLGPWHLGAVTWDPSLEIRHLRSVTPTSKLAVSILSVTFRTRPVRPRYLNHAPPSLVRGAVVHF